MTIRSPIVRSASSSNTGLVRTGIWSAAMRSAGAPEAAEAARELEELGFESLWMPGGIDTDVLDRVADLLQATDRLVIVTAVVNIWAVPAQQLAHRAAQLSGEHGDRFVIGLGVSHAPMVERLGLAYDRPLASMHRYLDELDAAVDPLPVEQRLLGALGPRMLDIARDRTSGAHPYLVTPEHTSEARRRLGPGALLAPELKLVLDEDRERVRSVGRAHLEPYLALHNYNRSLRRFGFGDVDLDAGSSDRLIDSLVIGGAPHDITAAIDRHVNAGADLVCLQVLEREPGALPRAAWRELSEILRGHTTYHPPRTLGASAVT